MKQDKKLMLGMILLFLICFVSFGVIIVNEKMAPYYIPKIDNKLNEYLKEKYSNILNDVKIGTTKYERTKYNLIVSNKENKNLNFRVYYDNKKITDTYNKDYLEGKTLLKYFESKTEKDINKLIPGDYDVSINNTLDKFTATVYDTLLKSSSILDLRIYNLTVSISVNKFNGEDVSNNILKLYDRLNKFSITPKTFSFIITDKNDITKAVRIDNIMNTNFDSGSINQIIDDIINEKESTLLSENNITYKYLN